MQFRLRLGGDLRVAKTIGFASNVYFVGNQSLMYFIPFEKLRNPGVRPLFLNRGNPPPSTAEDE